MYPFYTRCPEIRTLYVLVSQKYRTEKVSQKYRTEKVSQNIGQKRCPRNIGQNRVSKIGRVQDVQNRTVLGVLKYRTDAEQALKAICSAKDKH